jgi:hypothetical protein
MLTMEARKLKMEPCRVCSSVVADYRTITLMRKKIRIRIEAKCWIRIPIKVKGWIWIRMELKSWIRTRITVMWISHIAISLKSIIQT